jgi:hypothetical protein
MVKGTAYAESTANFLFETCDVIVGIDGIGHLPDVKFSPVLLRASPGSSLRDGTETLRIL